MGSNGRVWMVSCLWPETQGFDRSIPPPASPWLKVAPGEHSPRPSSLPHAWAEHVPAARKAERRRQVPVVTGQGHVWRSMYGMARVRGGGQVIRASSSRQSLSRLCCWAWVRWLSQGVTATCLSALLNSNRLAPSRHLAKPRERARRLGPTFRFPLSRLKPLCLWCDQTEAKGAPSLLTCHQRSLMPDFLLLRLMGHPLYVGSGLMPVAACNDKRERHIYKYFINTWLWQWFLPASPHPTL